MTNITNAIVELCCILLDAGGAAWEAADLAARLQAWRWVVTHPDQVDNPYQVAGHVDSLNERQERALQLAGEFGRVTAPVLTACFPLDWPDMIRVDLSQLVSLGLLERKGVSVGAYYTLGVRDEEAT